jgi:hypothetical protein
VSGARRVARRLPAPVKRAARKLLAARGAASGAARSGGGGARSASAAGSGGSARGGGGARSGGAAGGGGGAARSGGGGRGGGGARSGGAAGSGGGGRAGGAGGTGRGVAARPREALVRGLARGERLDDAVVAQVRTLIAAREHAAAQAVAASLRERPETETLGRVASGIVAYKRGYRALAWEELRTVSRETWARHAPAEFVRAGLAIAPGEALAAVRALVADDPDGVRMRGWYEIVTAVWGYGDAALARDAFAVFDRHVAAGTGRWGDAESRRDWLKPWIAASADSPTAPAPPDGRRTFAIMDYGHPSPTKASANIGDHVQSIAALGHLVRHQGVRLHGREDLVDLLEQLRSRTRPERQRSGSDADLEVITVHRDASMYEPIPEGTWVLAFGWFMHALFHMRHGFPLHRNLRPLFVSFHCNKRELLTPDAVAYLKRYGPVGCRDWTTVDLLLSLGVPAFFSGCLTTTIDTVFPALTEQPGPDAPLAYVDVPPADVPRGGITYQHSRPEVRTTSFVANVYTALDLLETYRRKHRGVVTSRLHCYLPVRSMGVDVDFQPKNRADIRFDGLIDITDEAFGAIRSGLLEKLEAVFADILGGAPEADVYARWRALTAADVAAAEERHARPVRLPPVAAAVGSQVERARTRASAHGAPADRAVHCAVVLRKGGGMSLTVLVASLLEHASRPLHLWVLARPGAEGIERRLAERFPQLTFTWVPTRGLAGELTTPTGAKPAGVARLLLPDLLADVDRVALLPLPAVAIGDVAELADLDLGGHPLAAATRPGANEASGFGVIHAAAARLEDRTQAASALRRSAHARHAFDFDAFATDTLVLDLAKLRADGFTAQALPLVEEFGLDDAEVLHYLLGPQRAALPDRWAVVPTRAPAGGAALLHWADRVKPWQPPLTPQRDRWRAYAAAYARGGSAGA